MKVFLKHLAHASRGCPPLVRGMHSVFRILHRSQGVVLGSARTITSAFFGTPVRPVFFIFFFPLAISAFRVVKISVSSLSPSSSAVISSSQGLFPLARFSLMVFFP